MSRRPEDIPTGYVMHTAKTPLTDREDLGMSATAIDNKVNLGYSISSILEPIDVFFSEQVKRLDASGKAKRIYPLPSAPDQKQGKSLKAIRERRREKTALESTDGIYKIFDWAHHSDGTTSLYRMEYEKKGDQFIPREYSQSLNAGELVSLHDNYLDIHFDNGKIGQVAVGYRRERTLEEGSYTETVDETATISVNEDLEAFSRVFVDLGSSFTNYFVYSYNGTQIGPFEIILDMQDRNDPHLKFQKEQGGWRSLTGQRRNEYVDYALNDMADLFVFNNMDLVSFSVGNVGPHELAAVKALREKSCSTGDYVQSLRELISLTPLLTLDDL